MYFNLKQNMTDIFNQPILSNEKFLTIQDVVLQALLMIHENDKHMTAEKKVEIFKLSCKCSQNDNVELIPDELLIIRERIGLFFAPLIVGRAFEYLG